MKKVILSLITLFAVSVAYSEEGVKNGAYISTGPLIRFLPMGGWGLSAGYERILSGYLTVSAEVGYGQVYLNEMMNYLIPGLDLKFHMYGNAPIGLWFSLGTRYYYGFSQYGNAGYFSIDPSFGLKYILNERDGLYFEPFVGFSIIFTQPMAYVFNIGLKIGWVF
jgi:hypothetical protein